MNSQKFKPVPAEWKTILNQTEIERSISRISYEILEKHPDLTKVAIVGIKTAGEFIARRIQARIREIENREVPLGCVDITLYRDDIVLSPIQPTLKGTDIPFNITGTKIILVDDVFYTGRTVRAALDAIIDFGRPESIELACLIDRGHREFPIRPDFVGKNIPSQKIDFVRLVLEEQGYQDSAYYITGKVK